MGLSIVSIKRSEVENKTEFEEFIPLMKALGCNPANYDSSYNQEIIEDLDVELQNYKNEAKTFYLTEEQQKQIPELEKIIAVCKNWDLYFCIY